MTLQAVVPTLDNVSEEVKALYIEKGDKFVLDISGIEDHPEVTPLSNAYTRQKEETRTVKLDLASANERLKAMPDDFDQAVWDSAKDGKTDQAALEAAKLEVRNAMQPDIDQWKGQYEALEGKVRTTGAKTQLTDALTKIGVTEPGFLNASRSLLMGDLKFNDQGNAYFDGKLGPMEISEHIERWAKDDGKVFITPPVGGGNGGNSNNGGGNNPQSSGGKRLADKVPGFTDLPVN